MGTVGNAHAVYLYLKESCTCPSTGLCYHIMAVKLSIGMNVSPESRTVNLTQVRRNTRGRKDKTSGRKKPRIGDYVAAPDSLAVRSLESVSVYKISCQTYTNNDFI